MQILVVDDDVELCRLLGQFLGQEGFEVSFAYDGPSGLECASAREVDLVVLDVMLPGLDGFGLLRELRKRSRVPVLMLTARGEDVDRIVGLEMGADDYMPKPFHPRELSARIRAIVRRVEERVQPRPQSAITIEGVSLDPATREVTSSGRPIDLTTIEFDILECLLRAAGRVLTRDALVEQIYNRRATPFDRSIDMHISHIRRKLADGQERIKTVRGVGYQFVKSAGGEG